MKLKDLLNRIPVIDSLGSLDVEVVEIVFDSRKAVEGALYVAVKGEKLDGHSSIASAIENGAKAIVGEKLPTEKEDKVTYILVNNSSKTLGDLASAFYHHPSEKLKLIGITGTNGKTSVTNLLYDVVSALGHQSALISTIGNKIGDKVHPTSFTTPDVLTINKLLAEAVNVGCEYAFMEVSSHGIAQKRIQGLQFQVAGFTNITRDHLDYHKTFEEYLKVKKSFFDALPSNAIAVTNTDDKNGNFVLQNTKAKKKTYAMKSMADYRGKSIEMDFSGMQLQFNGKDFWTPLTGKFNGYNLLLTFAIATELGFEEEEILKVLSQLHRIDGRFEAYISPSGIVYIVDYAHTPDALEKTLDTINEIRTKNERLLCVFGCGGNRDHGKRPEMGKIAARKATLAIVTSDNPRDEDPNTIIEEIVAGIEPQNYSKFTTNVDRKEAIKMAIQFAEPSDIILIAGKGHESYQEIRGEKLHFSDKETIRELLQIMGK